MSKNLTSKFFKIIFVLLLVFQAVVYADSCEEIFSDVDLFKKAITTGLELREEQKRLFQYYFQSASPYPQAASAENLQRMFDILKSRPNLSKIPVREQILEFSEIERESPESLTNFISSFKSESSLIRNQLFSVEQNLGFWAKMLGFNVGVKLVQRERKALRKRQNKEVIAYLNSTALNAKRRAFIKDSEKPYKARTIALYKALEEIRNSFLTPGPGVNSAIGDQKIIQNLSQAMAKLVHTAGFGNKAYVETLKSQDPQESLDALRSILNERDRIAFELGFEGDFEELKESLNAKMPDETKRLQQIMEDIQSQPHELRGKTTLRLRPLSLQESAFRSCFGGDCSTNHDFEAAFDPNFLYWTLTDSYHNSSGHVTLVLGTVENSKGRKVNTAFVDNIQNVSLSQLRGVLEGIRLSMKEQGYSLVFSKNVGDSAGLSNEALIREYVREKIFPDLKNSFSNFTPHEHEYEFKSVWFEKQDTLKLLEFESLPLSNTKISSGEFPQQKKAHPDQSLRVLYEPILSLEKSEKEEEQIRFLNHLLAMTEAEELNITDQYVDNHLKFVINNKAFSFNVRKRAFYIWIESFRRFRITIPLLEKKASSFSESEKQLLIGEMSNWKSALDYKKDFINYLTFNAFYFSDLKKILDSAWGQHLINKAELLNDILETKWSANESLVTTIRKQKMAKLLIERGANLNFQANDYVYCRWTALMFAIDRSWTGIAKLLIKKGANLNLQNNEGVTALMWAIHTGQTGIAKLLIEKGANLNLQNIEGWTALTMAREKNQTRIVRLIEQKMKQNSVKH